jgi:hypothetical protein
MVQFNIRMPVGDAQALAELLARANLFWIAEQYLSVPSELYPTTSGTGGSVYDEARSRWIDNAEDRLLQRLRRNCGIVLLPIVGKVERIADAR